MNFKQGIEIIVSNKYTAFLRATPKKTKKNFHSQNLNFLAVWKLSRYREKSAGMLSETSSFGQKICYIPLKESLQKSIKYIKYSMFQIQYNTCSVLHCV